MTDEWTLKTKAMDIKTVNTDLSKETCPVDNEQSMKVSRHLRDSISVTKYLGKSTYRGKELGGQDGLVGNGAYHQA